ncbi:MAG: sulfurtransferase TusA family protein [Methyloligellaceae bacterium]
MADVTIDTKGQNCPIPVLHTKRAMKDLGDGGTVEILATDPGSVPDFEAYCRATGNELLESEEESGVYRFVIKKVA